MKKFKLLTIIVILLGLVGVGGYFALNYFNPQAAGLQIETTPESSVFIDGKQAGRTPYNKTLPPGEITIKLVPDSFDQPLIPFETKVVLVSGVKTILKRSFASTLDESGGEVLAFEQVSSDETSISVVSVPDTAQVAIDGQIKGFTPFKTTAIIPGDHVLKLSVPGHLEKTINLETFKGFKLTAVVRLAVDPDFERPDEELESEDTQVEIQTTPTGFLRVRSEPSTLGKEIGKVEPAEVYTVLEEDADTGWYQIEIENLQGDKVKGWISDQYAKIVATSLEDKTLEKEN